MFVGPAYQIPAPFKAPVRGGKPDACISFSFNLYASPSPLLARALPLLTFENKSLEFEFQSELASKRTIWRGEEEMGEERVGGKGVGGLLKPPSLRKGLLSACPSLPPQRGPDRYKLGAIKLSPCHLCRIQSRIEGGREKERKREGERGEKLFR